MKRTLTGWLILLLLVLLVLALVVLVFVLVLVLVFVLLFVLVLLVVVFVGGSNRRTFPEESRRTRPANDGTASSSSVTLKLATPIWRASFCRLALASAGMHSLSAIAGLGQ